MPTFSSLPVLPKATHFLHGADEARLRKNETVDTDPENLRQADEETRIPRPCHCKTGRSALCIRHHLKQIAETLETMLDEPRHNQLDASLKSALLNPPDVPLPFWPWQGQLIGNEDVRPVMDYLALLSKTNAPAVPRIGNLLRKCRHALELQKSTFQRNDSPLNRIVDILDAILATVNHPGKSLHIHFPQAPRKIDDLIESSGNQGKPSKLSASRLADRTEQEWRADGYQKTTCRMDGARVSSASGHVHAAGTGPNTAWLSNYLAARWQRDYPQITAKRIKHIAEKLTPELNSRGLTGKALHETRQILKQSGIELGSPRIEFQLGFPESPGPDSTPAYEVTVEASLSSHAYTVCNPKGEARHFTSLDPDDTNPLYTLHVTSTLRWDITERQWKSTGGYASSLQSASPAVCREFMGRLISHIQSQKIKAEAARGGKDPAGSGGRETS